MYCRTDSGRNDHYCRFDGTNNLIDEGAKWGEAAPACFFNCQVRGLAINLSKSTLLLLLFLTLTDPLNTTNYHRWRRATPGSSPTTRSRRSAWPTSASPKLN